MSRLQKHGASLKKVAHPTSTLEDLFLRTVAESEARPGRRFEPGERPTTESEGGTQQGA
jgi:ABC-2 type transport system ATP-binding protein